MQLYTQGCDGPKELPSLRARHSFSLLEYGVIMIKSALSNLGHMAQLNPLLASFVNGLRDQILGPAYCKRCRFQQVVAGLPGLEPRLDRFVCMSEKA